MAKRRKCPRIKKWKLRPKDRKQKQFIPEHRLKDPIDIFVDGEGNTFVFDARLERSPISLREYLSRPSKYVVASDGKAGPQNQYDSYKVSEIIHDEP